MKFINRTLDRKSYEYHLGNCSDRSIAVQRYHHLNMMAYDNKGLTTSIRDPEYDSWGKWKDWFSSAKEPNPYTIRQYMDAFEVHRSILSNEVIVESDYKCESCRVEKKKEVCTACYELNVRAARIIGAILEHRGFTPLYYYSGSKSVHIHVYLSEESFMDVDPYVLRKLKHHFRTKNVFVKEYVDYVRKKMVSCWDLEYKQFDKNLIKSRQLIRSEMSKNKYGYKTFLGYTYKDLGMLPVVCNANTMNYPRLGAIVKSHPFCTQELIEEMIVDKNEEMRLTKVRRKVNQKLSNWFAEEKKGLRECVKSLEKDDFKASNDGIKRAQFILANEYVEEFGANKAIDRVMAWSARMGRPISMQYAEYLCLRKTYTLSCKYIHSFLKEIGRPMQSSFCV